MKLADWPRGRFGETWKRIDVATLEFARSVAMYREAAASVERTHTLIVKSRRLVQDQGLRRKTRLLRLLIGARIDEGRLPNTVPPVIEGTPGFGGECTACDGYMAPTRLMMTIPDGDYFVYVHAECYVIWVAQCRLRAILRRFEVA